MKTNVLNATIAVSEFFTYYMKPEEFVEIIERVSKGEMSARDTDVIKSFADNLKKLL